VHVRILDLVDRRRAREQLEGFGLVTGLSGTGDKGNAARQALANYIRRNNVNVANADVDIGTSRWSPSPAGSTRGRSSGCRSTCSAGGERRPSLFGGFLLQTPLKAADNLVYVVAQGPVAVGGFLGGARPRASRRTTSRRHADRRRHRRAEVPMRCSPPTARCTSTCAPRTT
jgi:flagellar P-ring protein precursor FlgI